MGAEKYLDKVKKIMIEKNPYGKYHETNFNNFNFGTQTPINGEIINDMPNGKIFITEEVYENLMAVLQATNDTNKEYPFFLHGKEIDNTVEFTGFYSRSSNNSNMEAAFNEDMIKHAEKQLEKNKNNGFVLCNGHTHPALTDYFENPSWWDLAAITYMKEDNEVFKKHEAEVLGCILTATGDLNFIFYDDKQENFYRFTNVYLKKQDNNIKRLNCYGIKNGVTRS